MRVELQEVRKSHFLPDGGFLTVLCGITQQLESGSSTVLSGPSGSGKTTLLNIVGGLARPTAGNVYLDGELLKGRCNHHGTVACAGQTPVFIPELTVMENLLLPLVCCKGNAREKRGELLLELFGLAEMFDLFPAALSGGEKQRLNLARAVISSPRLLLLDEPTACLGESWQENAMEPVLRQVRDTLATLVIASAGQIPCTAGFRQLRMQKGKVIEDVNGDN